MFNKIKETWKKLTNKKPKYNIGADAANDSNSELDNIYLFDFKNYSSGYGNDSGGSIAVMQGTFTASNVIVEIENGEQNTPKKIRLTPKEVLNELETIPTPFGLFNIDDKISMLKDKLEFIRQHYAKREVEALIERLENRKKYEYYKKFFNLFQNTTDEKIAALLEKHKHLVMKTSDIFIPEFPDIAIKTMKDYTNRVVQICKKKPVFYVIAEEDKFRKAYEKRDPILLVQSPFGFYWQILGAWDKEMLLLSEL
jgi:hypothetical protein